MAHPYKRHRENGKIIYTHRAVAELVIGRPLLPGEVVDHRNEDKKDFSAENVQVFKSQRQHMLYHQRKRKEAGGQPHLFDMDEYLKAMG